jgi:dihydroflavonol-4-reductase
MAAAAPTLVTGATGFIGSVLTRQLVEEGADVRILRRASSSLDLLGAAAEHVDHAVGDVTHPQSLLRAMEGIERVYHVAGRVRFARRDRAALRRVNAEGTAHVVNAALEAGVERLVHTSSIAALGRPAGQKAMIDETTEWVPAPDRSAYAQTKHRAELEVHRGIAEGLDAVIVNPSVVFGVGRPGTTTRRIVAAVRRRRLPGVPPGGTNVVDVQDVAAGHRMAMRRGKAGRRYVLAGDNLAWRAIIETLAQAFGVDPPRYTIPAGVLRAGAVLSEIGAFLTRTRPLLPRAAARTAARTVRYDNSRARDELGCSFRPFRATALRIAEALAA